MDDDDDGFYVRRRKPYTWCKDVHGDGYHNSSVRLVFPSIPPSVILDSRIGITDQLKRGCSIVPQKMECRIEYGEGLSTGDIGSVVDPDTPGTV